MHSKVIQGEELQWYYFPQARKGISPKVNVIARMEFEIADFESNTLTITTWELTSLWLEAFP